MIPTLNVLSISTALIAVLVPSAWSQSKTTPVEPPSANPNSIAASVGTFSTQVFWTADQTQADFLEMAGKHTKARWRTLYRPQVPTPTADRNRAAFTLGGLIGEAFLIWEAGDGQHFRNNNQEIIAHCRMLGLGDKIRPRLMTQSKMSESDDWKALRVEIVDTQQELMRVLREQRDGDLAVLVYLGSWIRTLEIVSKLVVETPDVDIWPLCIGSPALLADLRQHFASLSEATRRSPSMQPIINLLQDLEKVWNDKRRGPPTQAMVAKTHEQLHAVMEELMLK